MPILFRLQLIKLFIYFTFTQGLTQEMPLQQQFGIIDIKGVKTVLLVSSFKFCNINIFILFDVNKTNLLPKAATSEIIA